MARHARDLVGHLLPVFVRGGNESLARASERVREVRDAERMVRRLDLRMASYCFLIRAGQAAEEVVGRLREMYHMDEEKNREGDEILLIGSGGGSREKGGNTWRKAEGEQKKRRKGKEEDEMPVDERQRMAEAMIPFLVFRGVYMDACYGDVATLIPQDLRRCEEAQTHIDGCRLREQVGVTLAGALDSAIAAARDTILPVADAVLATWQYAFQVHEEEEDGLWKMIKDRYVKRHDDDKRTPSRRWKLWERATFARARVQQMESLAAQQSLHAHALLERLDAIEDERRAMLDEARELADKGFMACDPKEDHVECVNYVMARPSDVVGAICRALAGMELAGKEWPACIPSAGEEGSNRG